MYDCPYELSSFWKWMFKNYVTNKYDTVFRDANYKSVDINICDTPCLIYGETNRILNVNIYNKKQGNTYKTIYYDGSCIHQYLGNVKIIENEESIDRCREPYIYPTISCNRIENLYFECIGHKIHKLTVGYTTRQHIIDVACFEYIKIILHLEAGSTYDNSSNSTSNYMYNPIHLQPNLIDRIDEATVDMYIYSKVPFAFKFNNICNINNEWGIIYENTISTPPIKKLTINFYYQNDTITVDSYNTDQHQSCKELIFNPIPI